MYSILYKLYCTSTPRTYSTVYSKKLYFSESAIQFMKLQRIGEHCFSTPVVRIEWKNPFFHLRHVHIPIFIPIQLGLGCKQSELMFLVSTILYRLVLIAALGCWSRYTWGLLIFLAWSGDSIETKHTQKRDGLLCLQGYIEILMYQWSTSI